MVEWENPLRRTTVDLFPKQHKRTSLMVRPLPNGLFFVYCGTDFAPLQITLVYAKLYMRGDRHA